MRAIWVEAEGEFKTFESREKILGVLDDSVKFGFTDLFVQVLRGGRAWFRTTAADCSHLETLGFDPLNFLLEEAKGGEFRIHAWCNVFNLGQSPALKVLKKLPEEAFQIDNLGRDVCRYYNLANCAAGRGGRAAQFALDTPGIWLNPASRAAREFLCLCVEELCVGYPELSGIHLDFFRYPYLVPIRPFSGHPGGVDFGYSNEAISRFESECDLKNSFVKDAEGALQPRDYWSALAWDSWRREQVSGYLREFRSIIGAQKVLSVAAIAWGDRAYLNAFQDWRRWLSKHMLDLVCLMSYTADDNHFEQMCREGCAFRCMGTRLMGGVGLYRLKDPAQLNEQIEITKRSGSDGFIIFSYGALKGNREFEKVLVDYGH